MQVKTYWYVDTPYDRTTEDHWQSQSRFLNEFRRLNGFRVGDIKWVMGSGYPDGRQLHRWKIDNEEAAFNFMLAYGSNTFKREEELV